MNIQYWGPYCPLPQNHSARYVHVVYPLSRAVALEHGVQRELTQAEGDALADQYHALLARTLQEDWCS